MKNLPTLEKLRAMPDWVTAAEISRVVGIKYYRLKRNLREIPTIKLGDSPNGNLLYHVPDVVKFFESRIEVEKCKK